MSARTERPKLPKVLQLIGSFDQGGSERQALQLARLLQESGRCDVRLACLNPKGVLRQEAEQIVTGIPAYPLTSFYNWNAVVQHARFRRDLREQHIDLLHAHDFYTNIFGIPAAVTAGVSVKIASQRETAGVRSAAQKRVQHLVYRMADAVLVNANAVRRQLIEEGVPASKLFTVHNGVDLERLSARCTRTRDEALRLLALPAERRFVTILANMRSEVKDHWTFLRAAQRVRAAIPEAAFVLGGEGELMPRLRTFAAELGLNGDAFFIGLCRHVPDLLAIAEVCVLSSRAEGFSNSILEYMAAGKPAIVTDVGGAREAVLHGQTGYVVPPGDWEGMARYIVELLQDPERRVTMGRLARRRVEQEFSCEAQLKRTESLYEALLARRKR